MSRAISRESFNELKNYLGVYLQQGRPIVDSDWNENQDIAVSFIRRLSRESLGEGSPNRGFQIDPVFPPPPNLLMSQIGSLPSPPPGSDLGQAIGFIIGQLISICLVDFLSLLLYMIFGPLMFFLNFPGKKLEDFESLQGFALSSPQGVLRIGKDQPYEGAGFLRLSGHPGTVTVTKTLTNLIDLSAFELATFKFRMNHQTPGTMKFFIEDNDGNRSVWLVNNAAFASDVWMSGFAAPLDISFRIVTTDLPDAKLNSSYNKQLFTFGGKKPMTWQVSAGALPAGVTLTAGTGDETDTANFGGTPTALGTFNFTVKVTDASSAQTTRAFTLKVTNTGAGDALPLPTASEMLGRLGKVEIPTGKPAKLAQIRKYGFELYQDNVNPLVWDIDDLRLGSSTLENAAGQNNFIIRGSELGQFLNQITLLSLFVNAQEQGGGGGGGGGGDDDFLNALQNVLDLMNTNFELGEPSIENAGRYYIAGLPCVQIKDALYNDQADPNDPPLAPPNTGTRKDAVYLDAWLEPVTYVADPEIREIALGGPDTATRLRVQHRVRVNQGGSTPTGNGVGRGTLATEGTYTGQANRLYLVEVDTAGSIGTATCRWSEDNASTIQRVIEPLPPGSTRVVVEDAAAFHPTDRILIRKEFGVEEHQVSAVFANVITLVSPTGAQLATLPAASRVPNFTTFSIADRPMVQRWNAFKVPITADTTDTTVSKPITLNDGVQIRFGGKGMLKGDYWNFKTRYLAGDEQSGIDPVTRIEQLSFQHARGVIHYYAPLATLTRDAASPDPTKIFNIRDLRQRIGNASTMGQLLTDITGLTGNNAMHHVGGVPLLPAAADSKHVVFWSGDLFLPAQAPLNSHLKVRVSFYNDLMTTPATDQDTGKIQDREMSVALRRKQAGVEVPLNLMFTKSDTAFLFLPTTSIPTSVQVFVGLDTNGFSAELVNMQISVLELKKSF